MGITAPRTQDERLVPLLDTPPKWLPGIDVGIQINFHLKFFFFLFNWNILLIFLFSDFKFPLKGIGFSSFEFLGWILSSFFVCSMRFWCWGGLFLYHSLHPFGHCDRIGSLRFEPFKPSEPHYQGQNRAIPAPGYLWNCSRYLSYQPPFLFLAEAHVKCSLVKQWPEGNTPPLYCYSTKFHQAVENMHYFKMYYSILMRWETFFPLCPYIILTTVFFCNDTLPIPLTVQWHATLLRHLL